MSLQRKKLQNTDSIVTLIDIYISFQVKQDHQRWGYSTVTHLEQPVYLAIWKDLNKEKRKEHRKKIEP